MGDGETDAVRGRWVGMLEVSDRLGKVCSCEAGRVKDLRICFRGKKRKTKGRTRRRRRDAVTVVSDEW